MKLYVAVTRLARGGGPRLGSPREDIAVDVPDKSEASYELACTYGSSPMLGRKTPTHPKRLLHLWSLLTMKTHQAPHTLRRSIRAAEDTNRALVTTIDNRIAIILPRGISEEEAAEQISRIAVILGEAGFDTKALSN